MFISTLCYLKDGIFEKEMCLRLDSLLARMTKHHMSH